MFIKTITFLAIFLVLFLLGSHLGWQNNLIFAIFISIFFIVATNKINLFNKQILFSLLKKLVTFYLSLLFFIRSFFQKERPYIIPIIIFVFSINLYYPLLPFKTTIYDQMFALIYSGLYLIGVDSICSFVSKKIIENIPGFWDGLSIFFSQKNDNIFLDYYRSVGISALIIGKTTMTATGRAALGAAIIGGSFMLANTFLQGKQTAAEGEQNREFQAQQNQQNREFQAQQNQQNREFQAQQFQKQQEWNSYNSSWNPFKKPPK